MRGARPWVRYPAHWIRDRRLEEFKPVNGIGDETAALMCLIGLIITSEGQTSTVRATFDDLGAAVGISREKITRGLERLKAMGLIECKRRSTYTFPRYDENGWCKFPHRGLLGMAGVPFIHDFKLRKRTELDALKILFLIAALRDEKTNLARVGYEKIQLYTGVGTAYIRNALTLLATNGILQTEQIESWRDEPGWGQAYRLTGVDSRRHAGTSLRRAHSSNDLELS